MGGSQNSRNGWGRLHFETYRVLLQDMALDKVGMSKFRVRYKSTHELTNVSGSLSKRLCPHLTQIWISQGKCEATSGTAEGSSHDPQNAPPRQSGRTKSYDCRTQEELGQVPKVERSMCILQIAFLEQCRAGKKQSSYQLHLTC